MDESDRTASLMSPAKLAQMKPKAAATPAAWLNQMAADAGHVHVKRIGEIGEMLQMRTASRDIAAIASQLEQLAAALPNLDFSLLEPQGWWARTSGKSRGSGAGFAAQFERIDAATGALASVAGGMGGSPQADAALVDRALVELEVECRAVEKIVDQGARWLQDMRGQLKVRQATATDLSMQHGVLEDSHRCDILVDRLKLLRALCNSAAQVPAQVGASAQRRLALAQTLQQSLSSDVKDWNGRVSAVAAAATAGKTPAQGIQGALGAHHELQESVKKTISACEQLLLQDQELARSLAALGSQLPTI